MLNPAMIIMIGFSEVVSVGNGATCTGTGAAPDPLPAPFFFNDAVDGIVNTDSVMGISVSKIHGVFCVSLWFVLLHKD